MTLEDVRDGFPVLAAKLPENIFTDRELVVVDHNYEDADGEETGEFEPSEYNHIVYIAEPIIDIIGQEGLIKLAQKMEDFEKFDAFLATEEDLFGVQTPLGEDEISREVFGLLEEMLS